MLSIGLAAVCSADCPSACGLPSHPPEPENGTATTGEAARTPGIARTCDNSLSSSARCFAAVSNRS